MPYRLRVVILIFVSGFGLATVSHAEFLFGTSYLPVLAKYNFLDSGGNPPPAYASWKGEFAEWDILYAPHSAANYPDVTAPHGGELINGTWTPVTRSKAGFPANPTVYNPLDPLAFWDVKNPTITQTGTTTAFITGADSTGNIYSFQAPTSFVLADSTSDATSPYNAKTVMFQFQTDGSLADFSSIKLRYTDGTGTHLIAPTDYLREYQASSATNPNAIGSLQSRLALQWDLSALSISGYEIVWASTASSMSFQRARLDTADHYEDGAGLPAARTWTGTSGAWSAGANWAQGTTAVENGNVRFAGAAASAVTLDASHAIGEMIFETAANVTIAPSAAQKITSNTGISTTSAATGLYAVNAGWQLGALNLFDIAAGTVRLGGGVTGGYGLIKRGAGMLSLGGALTFSGGVTVSAGTLEIATGAAFTGAGNWEVGSGAKLRVNGAFGGAGALTLAGGTLAGSGTVSKSLTLDAGDRIAPGANVGTLTLVGAQTWAGGGGYEWQAANASQAGARDMLQVTGVLNLTATSGNRFTIYASSVTLEGLASPLAGFDPSQSYQWLIATVTGGVTGFSADKFTVNTSDFLNANGAFTVGTDGSSLFLNYAPIPEPGTWALLLLGGIVLLAVRRKGGAILR